jgi:hypothetical protein
VKTVLLKMPFEDLGRIQDSDGIIISVAPPQMETMGVASSSNDFCSLVYKVSIRESKRAGGSVCGVDIVIIVEMLLEGSNDVATTPPIECPIMMILVLGGYNVRIYDIACDVYAICDSRVEPWKAERSSLNSTARNGLVSSTRQT